MALSVSTAAWALLVSFAALGLSVVTFIMTELRRWERISIKPNFFYRINPESDQILFPIEFKRSEFKKGEQCLLVKVAYHGRHSLALRALYYQLSMNKVTHPEYALPEATRLYDGQSKSFLIVPRTFKLTYVTAIIIETESHGFQIKRTNPLRRWQLHWLLRQFWLSQFFKWAHERYMPGDNRG